MQTRSLLLATFLIGGIAEGVLFDAPPARAAGTAAGTAISNTASATYNDPNNAGTTLNATSNTVSVTVAEVAGLTAVGTAVTDTVAGHANNLLPGDVVNFDFTATNIGNAPNALTLPTAATLTGPGTAGTLRFSTDGGATFNDVPANGITPAVAANGTVIVRVPVTVSASAATGDVIKVLVGNTGLNDNLPDTQNIGYPDSHTGNDLHTNSTTAQNGQREASAFENGTVGTQPQAFATVLLTQTGFTQGATPAADTLTYGLGLNVASAAPTGAGASRALAAADLVAAPLTVNGTSTPSVLIADAIQAGTVLTGTPTAPSGWTVIYTTAATTTVAESAAWTTTAPTDLTTVTRVGFYAAGPVAKGAALSGFSYTVKTTGASATVTTQENNIAQLFGQTAGDTSNALVYDESGDQSPSNFNDDGSRGSNVPTNGVANPATDGTDAANNNTGTGAGGEDNVYTVSPSGAVLNGPNGQPGAVGPTGTNDDYSNVSAPIPAGTAPGTTITPAAVPFTNTLQNPGTTAISGNTLLIPLPPANAPGGSAADLPTGTTARIRFNSTIATYTYNGTAWTLTSGTVISIPSLAAGASTSYTVSVTLPAGTPLSTDTGKGFPVLILASVDSNGNGVVDAGEPGNTTIDRVYTGFLQVTKRARIVAADGTTVIQDYSAGPSSANIQPGRFIDYQLAYANISSAQSGAQTGNMVLNAANVVITEDGTVGGNNWALDQDGNGAIDTSNVVGSALDSGGATVSFFNGSATAGTDRTGTTAATDVTKYLDTIGSLAPGTPRTFTFRRKIN